MPTFALSTGTQPDAILRDILPALIVLFLLVVVGTIVLTAIRRSLKPRDDEAPDGFTLHGLRELHARGALSDEEFARAKAAVIDRTRGKTSGNVGETTDSSDTTPPDGPTRRDDAQGSADVPESPDDL